MTRGLGFLLLAGVLLLVAVGVRDEPGATIETTDGRRLTLVEPAGEAKAA